MRLPEDVVFLFLDEFVVRIVEGGLFEGRVSRVHDEEDDARCEDIATLALVFLGRYLGSHVTFSAQLGSEHSRAVLAAK